MVLDFSKVKKQLKYLIDLHIDHKLLVPVEHPYSQLERDNKTDYVKVDFLRPMAAPFIWTAPAEAYAFVYAAQVTMPHSEWLFKRCDCHSLAW